MNGDGDGGGTQVGRRPTRVDVATTGILALIALAVVALTPVSAPYREPDWRSAVLVAGMVAALVLRRCRPVLALAAAASAVVLLAAFGYEIGALSWAVWIALYSCFTHGGPRERAVAAVVTVAGAAGYLVFDPGESVVSAMAGVVLPTVVAALAGEAVRVRRAYTTELEARNAALERAQDLAARQLLLQERTRLARELHDALGHAVNVMVMQAGVADRVFDTNPGYGREALRSIADTGRDALAELDSLLGLLQPDGVPEPVTASGPSLADIPTVIQRLRDTGRQVDADGCDWTVEVPSRVGRAAFRILQEAMTNAVRHAGPGRITVRFTVDASSVWLEVRDEGGASGPVVPGRGLVNMAERARMVGGSFEAGPVAGGFRVRATLPLTEGGVR